MDRRTKERKLVALMVNDLGLADVVESVMATMSDGCGRPSGSGFAAASSW